LLGNGAPNTALVLVAEHQVTKAERQGVEPARGHGQKEEHARDAGEREADGEVLARRSAVLAVQRNGAAVGRTGSRARCS